MQTVRGRRLPGSGRGGRALVVVISTISGVVACAARAGFVRRRCRPAGRNEHRLSRHRARQEGRVRRRSPRRWRTSCGGPTYAVQRAAAARRAWPAREYRAPGEAVQATGARRESGSRESTARDAAPISVVFAADVGAAIERLLAAPAVRSPPPASASTSAARGPTWRELVELAAELVRESGIEVPPVAFDDAKENPLVSVDVGALSGAARAAAARMGAGAAAAALGRGGGGVGGRDARRVRWAGARRGEACAAGRLIGQTSSA